MNPPLRSGNDYVDQLIFEIEQYIGEYKVYWYPIFNGTTVEVIGAAGDWRIEDLAEEIMGRGVEYRERGNDALVTWQHT